MWDNFTKKLNEGEIAKYCFYQTLSSHHFYFEMIFLQFFSFYFTILDVQDDTSLVTEPELESGTDEEPIQDNDDALNMIEYEFIV